MKVIILGVLLAVMQATPPVPRQAANDAASSSGDIKSKGNPHGDYTPKAYAAYQ